MSNEEPETTVTVPEPALYRALHCHFKSDLIALPIVEQEFQQYDRANLHLTLESLTADDPHRQLVGIVIPDDYHQPSLAKLAHPATAAGNEIGPVGYVDLGLGNGEQLSCIKRGLFLFHFQSSPVAVLVGETSSFRPDSGIRVEVMALRRTDAESVSRQISKSVRHGKVFRGKVLSVESGCYGGTAVRFHNLPSVTREGIILPTEVLTRIERQAVGMTRHAERLKAAGRHLKRGILLHGKPGTGKTLCAMHLASRMPERTVIVLTGSGMGSIETACGLARLLQPSTVILEDVDLIGTERNQQSVGANALLFELLNQMDGLGEDVDVLFILTTNRPDHLEPALAARPGRVDLAIEIPLPDADCRLRLFELYGKGLRLDWSGPESWVARTRGVSAAFIRELLRKAAVISAEETDGEIAIADRHLSDAIGELLIAGGALTKSLLGVASDAESNVCATQPS